MFDRLSSGRLLLGFPFIISLQSNFCTALITQDAAENNGVNSHAQNTTVLQPNAFLTGIH